MPNMTRAEALAAIRGATSIREVKESFSAIFGLSVKPKQPENRTSYKDETSEYGLKASGIKTRERINEEARKILDSNPRPGDLTPEQIETLKQYSGRGGLTQNSQYEYYTPKHVAEGVWDALKANGFVNGNVLDPSTGHGMFSATKPKGDVIVTGCDIDKDGSQIAALLNPEDKISNKPFEQLVMDTPDGTFDSCVTNVPFGNARGASRHIDKAFRNESSLERYFITRILDKIKPGGLAVLICPTSVVGNKQAAWQNWRRGISRKAEFLGAHKLPSKTFASQGTDTVTDVVVLRKHIAEVAAKLEELDKDTLESTRVFFDEFIEGRYWLGEGKRFIMGQYFPKVDGDRWSRERVDGDVDDAGLKARLAQKFASRIDWAALELVEPEAKNYAPGDRKTINGIEYEFGENGWTRLESADPDHPIDREQFGAGTVEELLDILNNPRTCLKLTAAQAWRAFKAYGDRMGALASESIQFAMSQNPKLSEQLWRGSIIGGMIGRYQNAVSDGAGDESERLALQELIVAEIERYGHPANNKKLNVTGSSSRAFGAFAASVDRNGAFSDLLAGTLEGTGRTLQFATDDVQAIVEHLFVREGITEIDLETIKDLYTGGRKIESMADLADVEGIAITPGGMIEPMGRYCSGDIFPKIAALYDAAASEKDERLRAKFLSQVRRIDELRPRIDPERLTFSLRSKWIDKKYPLAFLRQFGFPKARYGAVELVTTENPYNGQTEEKKQFVENTDNPFGEWQLEAGKSLQKERNQFEKYLNGDNVRGGNRADATASEAKTEYFEYIQGIEEQFNAWMKSHGDISDVLDAYDRKYNGYLPFEHSGEDLGLRNVSGQITLKPHQNEEIRNRSEMGGGLIGFDVGVGKTFTALGLYAYNKQMGRSKRTCIAVPNSVLSNWYHESKTFLGNMDQVLFVGLEPELGKDGTVMQEPVLDEEGNQATDKNGNPMWRDRLIVRNDREDVLRDMWRIPQSNYSLIVMTHEKLKDIPVKPATMSAFVDKWTKRGLMDEKTLKDAEKNDKVSYGDAVKAERLEGDLSNIGDKKDQLPYLEDLGFTDIITDESHAFKNSFAGGEKTSSLAFVSQINPSQRGLDMQLKADVIREMNGGRGVYQLSATPVTNSPLEIFNSLAQVIPFEEFEARGISNPDDFMREFGETAMVDKLTVAAETVTKEGLVGFKNLDGLRALFNKYATLKNANDVGLELPEGEELNEEVGMAPEQETNYERLRREASDMLKGVPSANPRPIFSIMRDMETVTTDMDLFRGVITFHFQASEKSKVDALLAAQKESIEISVTPRIGDPDFNEDLSEQGKPQKAIKRTIRLADALVKKESGETYIVTVNQGYEGEIVKKFGKFKIDPQSVSHPLTPKYAKLVENCRTEVEANGKQIIFTDEKTQHGKLRRILAHNLGMDETKIAIINADEAKDDVVQQIAAAYNSGSVRIVIANKKAEVGLNLQKGTTGIHHLTFPWTPASITQRNGRGLRQGNTAGKVRIYYYQAKRSFDSYRLNTLNTKKGWLNELFSKNGEATAKNANATDTDELMLMFEADPEAAKQKLAEIRKAKEEKDRERSRAASVNKLQVLASNEAALSKLEAGREEQRKNLAEEIRTLTLEIDALKTKGQSATGDERKSIGSKIGKKQDNLKKAENLLATLDVRFDAKKTDLAAKITRTKLELKAKAAKNDLPFDAELIERAGEVLSTPGGKLVAVGDTWEYRADSSTTRIFKIKEVNHELRGFTAEMIIGNSLPATKFEYAKDFEGKTVHGWREIRTLDREEAMQVTYSEAELNLVKVLNTEFAYADLAAGIDKETFLEHYDKVKVQVYNPVFVRNPDGGVAFDYFDREKNTLLYPDKNDSSFREIAFKFYLGMVRSGASSLYAVKRTMAELFGAGFETQAVEYGTRATQGDVLEALASAHEAFVESAKAANTSGPWTDAILKEAINNGGYYGPWRSVGSWSTALQSAGFALGDNRAEIQQWANDFMKAKKSEIDGRAQAIKEEAERIARAEQEEAELAKQEALKADPNYKEVPENIVEAFRKIGMIVKINTGNLVVSRKTFAPFSRLLIQDTKGWNGNLRARKETLKARYDAKYFSDEPGEFKGSWWHVPSTVNLEDLYEILS